MSGQFIDDWKENELANFVYIGLSLLMEIEVQFND